MTAAPDHAGKAQAGMILGIVGLVAWFIPLFGLPITIVGIVLSAKGRKSTKGSMGTAGLIMSILGLAATVFNGALGAYTAVQGMK